MTTPRVPTREKGVLRKDAIEETKESGPAEEKGSVSDMNL